MDVSLGLDKAVTVVETTPYGIFLKDLNAQRTMKSGRMIGKRFAKPSPMKGRLKKQPTDFISDQGNKTERFFILFQHPGFRVRKVDVTHVLSHLRHKVV